MTECCYFSVYCPFKTMMTHLHDDPGGNVFQHDAVAGFVGGLSSRSRSPNKLLLELFLMHERQVNLVFLTSSQNKRPSCDCPGCVSRGQRGQRSPEPPEPLTHWQHPSHESTINNPPDTKHTALCCTHITSSLIWGWFSLRSHCHLLVTQSDSPWLCVR